MSARKGGKPWNWRGEPITDPRGYVLVFVGKGHPLADCRGYAYQHRLNAARAGQVVDGRQVHHDDEVKSNNAPGNLDALTPHEHRARHRKPGSRQRNPDEPNPNVLCACGCGGLFPKFDRQGRPRRMISGHNVTHGTNGRFESRTM